MPACHLARWCAADVLATRAGSRLLDPYVLGMAHCLACFPTRLAYEYPLDAAARDDPPELVARVHDLPFDAEPPAELSAFDKFLLAYQLGFSVKISAA